ncbi:protein FAM8A1 [Belonocnema kinseyi]|uniref:protein FAM8A1 n=1 Tax=Belonocnema kinseyi TaxID=2817044 RepID=UPI00143D6C4E|nr:protein FAM8A1 [Belonocnema kinseyi]XP_033208984.1 protein FAM8A1 [Belonocnema kinseyi]XP_033208985.1 protein FAM8A1 [Belonocnema kinseyi]XP_033208987.1 protein FAM8A1 [Belonocnema kinseyi]XP_033208988.1 protein FAM8A1 [Belonocnema kinseyi]
MSHESSDDSMEKNRRKSLPLKTEYTNADRSKYFDQLETWLQEIYAWQGVISMFPHYLISSQMLHPSGISICTSSRPQSSSGARTLPQVRQNNESLRQRRQEAPAEPPQPPDIQGVEYRIPPIWKRLAAESIDSIMLFLLKLSITFIAVDVFDFINIEPYDFDLLQRNLRIDYKMAVELTSGILILELVHRLIVCIFEAFWLRRGLYGHVGGATPGKSVMGLRVVQCRSVSAVERPDGGELVLVSPGTDLGLPLAVGRSVVKNLILAFLFPICFTLFFFRFNRTGYDIVCNSIVVEDPHRNRNNNVRRFPQQ